MGDSWVLGYEALQESGYRYPTARPQVTMRTAVSAVRATQDERRAPRPPVGAARVPVSAARAAASAARAPLDDRRAARRPETSAVEDTWLTVTDIAHMLLRGECLDARVSVPQRFAPQAVESAMRSVERWRAEGRIFAIHGRYPRYQFDANGRPYPSVERVLGALGADRVLRVGNWFALPNEYLAGSRPQDVIATHPESIEIALAHA